MEFVEFLNEQYASRKANNARYSKRAMAKQLNISSSYFIRVLNGQLFPSPQLIIRVAAPLSLSEHQIEYYIADIRKKRRDIESRYFQNSSVTRIEDSEVQTPLIQLLANWKWSIILELSRFADFDMTETYLSSKLKISIEEAREIIDFVIEHNIFSVVDGKLKKNTGNHLLFFENTSKVIISVIKCRQTQLLEEFLVVDNFEKDQSCLLSSQMAIDSELMYEARIRIFNFQKQFVEWVEKNSVKRDSVYDLSLNFIPLVRSS